MKISVKQFSSLLKIRNKEDFSREELFKITLFQKEHFFCQISVLSEEHTFSTLSFKLEKEGREVPCDFISGYILENAVMDFPVYEDHDDDIITDEPGLVPDILRPFSERRMLSSRNLPASFVIEMEIPSDMAAGEYMLKTVVQTEEDNKREPVFTEKELQLTVLPCKVPEERIHFTQWFHVDCIAEYYHVPVYSEAHWSLIAAYMKAARKLGIDTILTPVLTPALDTRIGTRRLNTQLVKIRKEGEKFLFDFSLLSRYIDLALLTGMKQLEISHLFSQWGLKSAPNIFVTENGTEKWYFGWHTDGHGEEYYGFLKQFVPALVSFLEEKGVLSKCLFHLSDEPGEEALSNYKKAHDFIKPMLKGRPIMDALSNVEFYRQGIPDIPVTAINHIEPFLRERAENQWAYYCCSQYKEVGNRFMAFPSWRNRILGVQLYKFDIKGFLQWGFNFYHSAVSAYFINPYVSTSADRAHPSGDDFSVYPGENGPLYSLRALVFKEALSDAAILRALEEKKGREYVLRLIDEEAGMEVTFKKYPRNASYIPRLMDRVKNEIAAAM